MGLEDDAAGGILAGAEGGADLNRGLGELDDLARRAVFLCLWRDLAAVEFGELAADRGAPGFQLAGHAEVEDGVFADETAAIPDRERLALRLDEQVEIQRHDDEFLPGLEVLQFHHPIEVHDHVERGAVLGGDAEKGVPALYDMGELARHVGGGEHLVEVHLTDDAAGHRRGG